MPRNTIEKRGRKEGPQIYIDAKEYTAEVIKYSQTGVCSERLGELFKLHVDRFGSTACFKNYTYLDEMKGKALLYLVQYSHKFNPEKAIAMGKTPNAFSYCTTIMYNAFIQVINKEKQNTQMKDKLIKAKRDLMLDIGFLKGQHNTNESDVD